MRYAWFWAVALPLAACSSGFSAGPADAGGSDVGEENPSIQGDSGGDSPDGTTDATSSSDSGHSEGGPGDAASDGTSAEAGCTGLMCGGACVPSDVHNCGTCGHDCTSLPHVSGAVTCSASGACTFPVSSCAPGWTQCLRNPDPGCETNIATTSNCGSCGNMCSGNAPSCSGSGSTYGCVSGCPGADPTLCSGTCVDTTSNANDCSTCGNACSTTMPHAQPTCVASACSFSCNTGYPLCGGACIDPTNDDNNCNGCGNKCTGGTHCVNSACQCTGGLINCSGTCTNTSTTVADCGSCGHGCYGGSCQGGVCQRWVVAQPPATGAVNEMAADGQYFVWSDNGLNAVLDVPLTGGSTVSIYSGGNPQGVAVAGAHVAFFAYATAGTELALFGGTAGVASSATMTSEVAVSLTTGFTGPVFDPAGANSYAGIVASGNTDILQCAVGASGPCNSLPYQQLTSNSVLLRATSSAVWVLDEANGGPLYMQPTAGSVSPTVLQNPTGGNGLAVDAVNFYWSTAVANGNGDFTSTIYAQPITSTTSKKLVTVSAYVNHLMTDGTNVYFSVASSATTTDAASIQYVPIGGAASTKTLYTGALAPVGLVAAAGAIYWVEDDDSTIEGLRFP